MTYNSITPEKTNFKKFGGEHVGDVVDYVNNYVASNMDYAVAVGCDSQQLRKSTCYVIAIAIWNPSQKNGAHVIFKREYVPKIKVKHDAAQVSKLASSQSKREPITDYDAYRDMHPRLYGEIERVAAYCEMINEGLSTIPGYERKDYSADDNRKFIGLVDAHLDLNPDPGTSGQNKSNILWAAGRGMLEGLGFRTFTKPAAYAASCAADLLCK